VTTSKECKNEKNEKKGSDTQFLESLKANPAYKGIDIDRELGKCQAWCIANGKSPNKRRFVNWLNRADKPINVPAILKMVRKPSATCTACNGSGFIPETNGRPKIKCWCY
jgi:hypothetical protein